MKVTEVVSSRKIILIKIVTFCVVLELLLRKKKIYIYIYILWVFFIKMMKRISQA